MGSSHTTVAIQVPLHWSMRGDFQIFLHFGLMAVYACIKTVPLVIIIQFVRHPFVLIPLGANG